MPRHKGIGRKSERKRDTLAPYLRPKGKQKLETTGRAEEPCSVDSDDGEFSDCDDGFGAVINDEMLRGAIAVTFVEVFDAPPECEWEGRDGTISDLLRHHEMPDDSRDLVLRVLVDVVECHKARVQHNPARKIWVMWAQQNHPEESHRTPRSRCPRQSSARR